MSSALAGEFFTTVPPVVKSFLVLRVNLSKLWEITEGRGSCCAAIHGAAVRHHVVTEQQVLRVGAGVVGGFSQCSCSTLILSPFLFI